MNSLSKRQILMGLGLAPLLQACSPLNLFNTLAPKDKDSRLLRANVPYGEGKRRTYDVYAPDGMTGPPPVLVFFYGGGWSGGSKDSYVWAGRALAALGYVTVLPDYRLVPEVHYPAFVEDCGAAVRHVMANAEAYGGDASRLALMGHSAGAYNAMMVALVPEYLGLKPGAPSPVKAMVGVAGPYDFLPFDPGFAADAFGQWPKPEETQPVNHVHKTNTKFLLLYSLADKTVGPKNAISLDKKLKAAGAGVQSIAYEKPSHTEIMAALSVPFRSKAPTLKDTHDFLAANV
ncbi:MAG: alpha/beta hydrolase [Caulobacterales bacterium]